MMNTAYHLSSVVAGLHDVRVVAQSLPAPRVDTPPRLVLRPPGSAATSLPTLISEPAFPRPVPEIGWLGVLAIAVWVALALACWRMAVLTGVSFALVGMLGSLHDSMDLLVGTLCAVPILPVLRMRAD